MPVDQEEDGIVDFGMIELWASDFDAGSYHPCGYPVELSFSADVNDKNKTFDCLTRGNQLVEIWATVTTPTGELVQTYCSTFVDIQDNMNSCVGQRSVSIQGNVYTEANQSVDNVSVTLEGSPMAEMTDLEGQYAFPNMGMGGNYVINPYSNQEVLNVITIQRHILGIELLDSPYKFIAADVDNNNVINGVDLVELRKLILGIYTEFPANDSWRFVDKGYTFTNLIDPLSENFTEDYQISTLDNDMDVDFVAVKIGDVNDSVEVGLDADGISSNNKNNIVLTLGSATEEDADLKSIPVSVEEKTTGMQLEFSYSSSEFEIVDIQGVQAELNPANFVITDNKVVMSWNSTTPINGTLFNIIGKQKESRDISSLSLSESRLQSESYTEDGQVLMPVLKSDGIVQEFKLTQNTPNPFNDFTMVNIGLTETSLVELKVSNLNRLIYKNYCFWDGALLQ